MDYFSQMLDKLEPFLQLSHYTNGAIMYTAITDEGKEYLLITNLENRLESISLVERYKGHEIKLTVATRERVC